MLLLKFKFYFLLMLLVLKPGFSQSYDTQCLSSVFQVDTRQDQFIFGLVERKLSINKRECVLEVRNNYLKFFNNYWNRDRNIS